MFDFSSPLKWYNLIFVAEIIIAELLATYTLNKKSNFIWRIVGGVLVMLLAAFLFPIIYYNAIYASFMFLVLFFLTLLVMKFYLDEPWPHILFCGIIAYTCQHIAYIIYNYICFIFDLSSLSAVYDGDIQFTLNEFNLIAYFATYSIVYWAIWAFVENRIRSNAKFELERSNLLFVVAVIILVNIILNAFIIYDDVELDTTIQTVLLFYGVISCLLSMVIQFSLLSKRNAEDELKEVQALWRQDKRMYELSKQNVELINIKCHDLKHQIKLLRHQSGEITRDALKDIERAVNFYDGSVKTGNDVLDLILAEKNLYCSEHDITLTCIADASKLSYISIVDMYSLFENAVRNAIEAVEDYDDSDKKFIRLKIMEKIGFISIHIENWIDEESSITLVNGLPQTNKEDKHNHGFGMKSILRTVEKYGGALNVDVSGHLFALNIIFPLDIADEVIK